MKTNNKHKAEEKTLTDLLIGILGVALLIAYFLFT